MIRDHTKCAKEECGHCEHEYDSVYECTACIEEGQESKEELAKLKEKLELYRKALQEIDDLYLDDAGRCFDIAREALGK